MAEDEIDLMKHTGIVATCVKRFGDHAEARLPVEDREAWSVAWIGATKAQKTFDPSHGCKFSTYLWVCCKNELLRWRERKKIDTALPLTSDPATKEDDHGTSDYETMLGLIPDERSRLIVRLRCEGVTLATIGKRLGVCKERVRQIESQTLAFLQSTLKT